MKDKELRKLIGSRAKQRRLELNLTQPYVAEKMGVTASTIPVSYTHLDVYKRQVVPFLSFFSYRSFCHNRVSPFDIRQSELMKCFLRVSIS